MKSILWILITWLISGAVFTNGGEVLREKVNEQDQGEMNDMGRSVEILMNAGGIDRDSAEGTMETLQELGIASVVDAETVPSQNGTTILAIADDGNVYYLGYGAFGYLEIVRKDTKDGEILYAPVD